MNRFLGCVAKRFYCVDRHQVRHFRPPRLLTRWFKYLWIMALVASAVLITVYFGLETIPYTERKHLVLMSRGMERELGDFWFNAEKDRVKDKILPPDHPYSIRVQSIAQKIIQTSRRGSGNERNRLNWEVLVVDSSEFNAFCMQGGKVVLYTELLKHFDSDEMIAWIVRHEVGHLVARHYPEVITNEIELLLIGLIVSLSIEEIYRLYIRRRRVLHIVTTCCFVYVMLTVLVRLPSSRRRELEADYIGMRLMASAGYDPRMAPRVLKRIGELTEDNALNEIFWTHPAQEKRVQSLARADVMEEALIKYREAGGSTEETQSRDWNHLRKHRKEDVPPYKERVFILKH